MAYGVGLEWTAQVRGTSVANTVDATFVVTAGTSPDPEESLHFLSLSSSVTAYLCNTLGTQVTVREKGSNKENIIKRYIGRYDIQISGPGGTDPVLTLGTGEITVDLDVTRTP